MTTPVTTDDHPGGMQLAGDYTRNFLMTRHASTQLCALHGDDPTCPFSSLD